MQLPLWQSSPFTHAPPLVRRSTQRLATQYWVAVQALQSPSQAVPLHAPGAQLTGVPVAQLPPPSHVPAGVAVPPLQLAAPQDVA
jgi:hypothetical protein